MNVMEPSVMRRQVEDLGAVHREQLKNFDRITRTILDSNELLSLHKVYLTGDGDSFHASLAAEYAFEQLTGIACEPQSAQRFRDYSADFLFANFPNDTLVVGISASGRTQRVVECFERAHAASDKVITLALTGTPGSKVAESASRAVVVQVPPFGPSPGIRTYNATLLGLYLLAIRIGEVKNRYHNQAANALRDELAAMGDQLDATVAANIAVTAAAADAFHKAPFMVWAGSGPSFGTAMFSAAKVVEASGMFSVGQDLEEWSHVERFAYPDDTPTVVIAPPGRSYARAADLARQAKELGRRLAVVVAEDDREIAPLADFVFPISGSMREEFSPLAYHIPGTLLGWRIADALERKAFQSDTPRAQAARAAAQAAQAAG